MSARWRRPSGSAQTRGPWLERLGREPDARGPRPRRWASRRQARTISSGWQKRGRGSGGRATYIRSRRIRWARWAWVEDRPERPDGLRGRSRWTSRSWARPTITASGLFSSWPAPAANSARASSFAVAEPRLLRLDRGRGTRRWTRVEPFRRAGPARRPCAAQACQAGERSAGLTAGPTGASAAVQSWTVARSGPRLRAGSRPRAAGPVGRRRADGRGRRRPRRPAPTATPGSPHQARPARSAQVSGASVGSDSASAERSRSRDAWPAVELGDPEPEPGVRRGSAAPRGGWRRGRRTGRRSGTGPRRSGA